MKKYENLTLELTKHIFGILGFGNPFITNLIGITFDKFSNSKININYEDIGDKSYSVYSAKSTMPNNSIVKIVGTCLENLEFCAIIKCDDGPIFGLKLISISDDPSDDPLAFFLVAKTGKNWTNPSISDKLMVCAGLELLNDAGMQWKPEPVGDLEHSCLLDFVEM